MRRTKLAMIICIVACMLFALTGMAFAQPTDIDGHWAESQITNWYKKGLSTGYQDGTFKPDNTITRAEFVALVNRSFQFTETVEFNFPDVQVTDWCYQEVAKARAAEYINGFGDGTFKPNQQITRQEAAAMLARLLKLDTSNTDLVANLKDADIPQWSAPSINAVMLHGYMNGYQDETFKPANFITRAETIVTLDRAINAVTYNKAGTFGPAKDTDTITGNVIIDSADVTLQNTIVEGNLILTAAIGNGDVHLKNVTVKGTTFIRGGGSNSVTLEDCKMRLVNLEKNGVRVVAKGKTAVDKLVVASNAKVDAQAVSGVAIADVVIAKVNANVTLAGNFDNVDVTAVNTKVELAKGTVKNFTVTQEATVNLAKDTKVTTLNLEAKSEVKGEGKVDKVNKESSAKDSTVTVGGPAASTGGGGGGGSRGGGGGGSTVVNVSAININEANQDLKVGETLQLTTKFTPENPTNKKVTWKSSNDEIVTVSSSGLVTAKAKGEATITVTTEDGNKTDSVVITVVEEPVEPQPITGSFESTNNIGIAPESAGEAADKIYAEYKLVAEGKDISLAASNVEYIKVKVGDGEWKELTANTDATLWFNVEVTKGVRSYEVKTKDGKVYTATLDWDTAIKTATWTATGGEGIRPGTEDKYVEYKLMDGTNQVSLKVGVAKLFASKTEGKWKSHELNTDQTLWVKKDTATGSYEYFIVAQDGTMYKTTLEYTNPVDQAEADAVEALITALPGAGKVTLDDEENIEAARAAYDVLTPAQQALVANVAALVAAEAELGVLLEEELEGAVAAANIELGKVSAALAAYIEAGGEATDTDYTDVTAAQTALNNALAASPKVGYEIIRTTETLTLQLDILAMATDIELIQAGTYEIPLANQTDQAAKTAWVQGAVGALIANGSTATVTWVSETSSYEVALVLNKATGKAIITVTEYEEVVEPEVIPATWNATGQVGHNIVDGKAYVFQEFELLVDGKRISLASDNIKSIKVGDKELTPNTDETLWMNVLKDSGASKYTIVDNYDKVYEATLTWAAPADVAATKTGDPAYNEERKETYQLYTVAVDVTPEDSKVYQIKPDGTISELTVLADADSQLNIWFRLSKEGSPQQAGDHIFLVKKGDNWSKAVIEYIEEVEDVTDLEIKSATVVKDEDGNLVLTVVANDENLYSLEVDHSHGKHGKWSQANLPEFSVYASETNPWGTIEDQQQFEAAGVTVAYDANTQTWTLTFEKGKYAMNVINDEAISNGAIDFYLVVHDEAGNSSGDMDGNYLTVSQPANEPVAEVASTYSFDFDVPETKVNEEVTINVTFATDEEGDYGYEGVRFKFTKVSGSGDATFTAIDSKGNPYLATNEGYWGPGSGFNIDAVYSAMTPWKVTFNEAGTYEFEVSLIYAPEGEVVAGITETVTVNVVAEEPSVPELTVTGPGAEVAADAENFTVTFTATHDKDLAYLEIDHNLGKHGSLPSEVEGLPEFKVYSDASNPWGSDDAKNQATAYGVLAEYDADNTTWTLTFGGDVLGQIRNLTAVHTSNEFKIYSLVGDVDGIQSGSMYDGSYVTTVVTLAEVEEPVEPQTFTNTFTTTVTEAIGSQGDQGTNYEVQGWETSPNYTYTTDGAFYTLQLVDGNGNLVNFASIFEEFTLQTEGSPNIHKYHSGLRNQADFTGATFEGHNGTAFLSDQGGTLRNTSLNGTLFYGIHSDIYGVNIPENTNIKIFINGAIKEDAAKGSYNLKMKLNKPTRQDKDTKHTFEEFKTVISNPVDQQEFTVMVE